MTDTLLMFMVIAQITIVVTLSIMVLIYTMMAMMTQFIRLVTGLWYKFQIHVITGHK